MVSAGLWNWPLAAPAARAGWNSLRGQAGTRRRARWNTPRGAAVEGIRWSNGGLLGDEPDGLADLVELCHRRGCGAAFLARLHHDALTVQVQDPEVDDDPASGVE